jgi:cobalamin biosynthetic protein CobC
MAIEHGGNVGAAANKFNVAVENWIDLSTGISPWSWPVPEIPQSVWQTLPYSDLKLERAAASYYGCELEAVLAVPGSQYALQYAPALLPIGRVAIPQRGYAEHRLAWVKAGHRITEYTDAATLDDLVTSAAVDHVLLINPNNPTGEILTRHQLQSLHAKLRARGGYLVVDEAFADMTPATSMASCCPKQGLIVYRSIGKFFGLGGVRLGFMLAPPPLCRNMESVMPPWLLSHPARWLGREALKDGRWQVEQHNRLQGAAAYWIELLGRILPRLRVVGTALFVTGAGEASYCESLYSAMGRRGLLVRLFESIDGQRLLRFGLPLPSLLQQVERLIRESVEECE